MAPLWLGNRSSTLSKKERKREREGEREGEGEEKQTKCEKAKERA